MTCEISLLVTSTLGSKGVFGIPLFVKIVITKHVFINMFTNNWYPFFENMFLPNSTIVSKHVLKIKFFLALLYLFTLTISSNMIVNRWCVNIGRKESISIVQKWLNWILNYQLQHCSKDKQHQHTTIILTSSEEDKVCNVLQVVSTAILTLSTLSTI